jgi:hypothetical protein
MEDIKTKLQSVETFKNFDELGTSTMTVMAYSNVNFNLEAIYNGMPIYDIDVPLTKKKKLPDMKKVVAPKDKIISVRYKNEFRGIVTSTKKTKYFLNQVTFIISIGNKNLNIFIFNNKLKIAGCKKLKQAEDVMIVLWNILGSIKNSYTVRTFEHILNDPKIDMDIKDKINLLDKKEFDDSPRFIFEVVMSNVDFKLGFKIDRKKLNNLMNSEKYSNIVHISRFETTGNTNVNIKMFTTKPKNYVHHYLTFRDNVPSVGTIEHNIYDFKKKKKVKYNTFLVFRSSKVIESGCYSESMGEMYDKFISIINNNRCSIEEKIDNTEMSYVHNMEVL